MTTSPMSASSRSRSAWLASTSAVAQMIGAPGLTAASPVSMPTCAAPKISTSAKNFSLTRALIGAVYQLRRPSARASACAATATSDLPDPVGVASTTWAPPASASTASSCAAYRAKPRSPAQSRKTSNAASAPAVGVPERRSVRVIVLDCPSPEGVGRAPAAQQGCSLLVSHARRTRSVSTSRSTSSSRLTYRQPLPVVCGPSRSSRSVLLP